MKVRLEIRLSGNVVTRTELKKAIGNIEYYDTLSNELFRECRKENDLYTYLGSFPEVGEVIESKQLYRGTVSFKILEVIK